MVASSLSGSSTASRIASSMARNVPAADSAGALRTASPDSVEPERPTGDGWSSEDPVGEQ